MRSTAHPALKNNSTPTYHDLPLLRTAARDGKLETVKKLLQENPELSQLSSSDVTIESSPLAAAVTFGHFEVASYLLANTKLSLNRDIFKKLVSDYKVTRSHAIIQSTLLWLRKRETLSLWLEAIGALSGKDFSGPKPVIAEEVYFGLHRMLTLRTDFLTYEELSKWVNLFLRFHPENLLVPRLLEVQYKIGPGVIASSLLINFSLRPELDDGAKIIKQFLNSISLSERFWHPDLERIVNSSHRHLLHAHFIELMSKLNSDQLEQTALTTLYVNIIPPMDVITYIIIQFDEQEISPIVRELIKEIAALGNNNKKRFIDMKPVGKTIFEAAADKPHLVAFLSSQFPEHYVDSSKLTTTEVSLDAALQALHDTARDGNLPLVKSLSKRYEAVLEITETEDFDPTNHPSPLAAAINAERFDIVDYLLSETPLYLYPEIFTPMINNSSNAGTCIVRIQALLNGFNTRRFTSWLDCIDTLNEALQDIRDNDSTKAGSINHYITTIKNVMINWLLDMLSQSNLLTPDDIANWMDSFMGISSDTKLIKFLVWSHTNFRSGLIMESLLLVISKFETKYTRQLIAGLLSATDLTKPYWLADLIILGKSEHQDVLANYLIAKMDCLTSLWLAQSTLPFLFVNVLPETVVMKFIIKLTGTTTTNEIASIRTQLKEPLAFSVLKLMADSAKKPNQFYIAKELIREIANMSDRRKQRFIDATPPDSAIRDAIKETKPVRSSHGLFAPAAAPAIQAQELAEKPAPRRVTFSS